IAEKTGDAVEDVAAFETASEDLPVTGMQPLAAGLHGVPSGDDGKVVLHLNALDCFVDVGRDKKRIAEAERRGEPHRRVGRHRGVDGGARTVFARVADMEL